MGLKIYSWRKLPLDFLLKLLNFMVQWTHDGQSSPYKSNIKLLDYSMDEALR